MIQKSTNQVHQKQLVVEGGCLQQERRLATVLPAAAGSMRDILSNRLHLTRQRETRTVAVVQVLQWDNVILMTKKEVAVGGGEVTVRD